MSRSSKKTRAPRIADGRVSFALQEDELQESIGAVTIWPNADPANADVYAPRPNQRVPKGGAWAMVTRALPPLEFELHERVRVGCVFYVDHHGNADDDGFVPDGTYKVTCVTPWHELTLWPYEYSIIEPSRVVQLWQDGALLFHPMNMAAGQFDETVFYARSRGIGVADAVVMALGTLRGPVGWFQPHPDLAPDLEAMASRIHTSLAEHIRRHPRQTERKL